MNLSITLRDRRTFKEYAGLFMIKTGAWIVVALFLASLGYICYHGAGTLSPSFLSSFPEKMMEEGGILPCIIGTAILSIGAMAVALPLGIVCAVWLNEYAKEGPLKKLITLAVANLAGVPSIVFGLGVSAIAGILTLAVLTLPIVINTVRETLSQIPNSWRESSLALGASKTQTVLRTVLPAALPGILTGAILGLARAAGETSAIMFTAAVVSTTNLPNSPFAAVMSLPYHIYVLATTGMNPDKAVPIQCATALVLLMTVFALNLMAFYIRQKSSKRPA